MRIAINGCSFSKRQYTGIGRYAFNLVRVLSEIDQDHKYQIYFRKRLFDPKRRTPKYRSSRFQLKRDCFRRGIARTISAVDLYHAPSPEILPELEANVVVTVHDMIFKTYPQGHTPQTIVTTDQQMTALVERADRIICCSRSTATDLQRYYSVPDEQVKVVYQGVDKTIFYPLEESQRMAAREALRSQGILGPYLLFVGTLEPRKNLNNLLLAFKELKEEKMFLGQLVVVGMKGWMSQDLEETLSDLGIRADVVPLGFVPDDMLRSLYNCAEAFVFPSHYEGFGFPILEAFCCGAPVVTSDNSSCGEIAADAALTVNSADIDDLVKALTRVLQDPSLPQHLRQKGFARAQDFSFLKTAQETLNVYESLKG